MPSKIRGGTKDKHLADMHIPRVSALGASSPPYLLSATFTAANGTLLANYTPELGIPFTSPATEKFTIQSNKAQAVAGGAMGINAVGVADVIIEATVTLTGGGTTGIVARYTDATHYLLFGVTNTGGKLSIVLWTVNGSFSMVDKVIHTDTYATGVAYTLRLSLLGSTIVAELPAKGMTITATSTLNQTATTHGMRAGDTGDTVDTYSIVAVGALNPFTDTLPIWSGDLTRYAGNPVITTADTGTGGTTAADPCLWVINSKLYIFFESTTGAGVGEDWMAESEDGVTWTNFVKVSTGATHYAHPTIYEESGTIHLYMQNAGNLVRHRSSPVSGFPSWSAEETVFDSVAFGWSDMNEFDIFKHTDGNYYLFGVTNADKQVRVLWSSTLTTDWNTDGTLVGTLITAANHNWLTDFVEVTRLISGGRLLLYLGCTRRSDSVMALSVFELYTLTTTAMQGEWLYANHTFGVGVETWEASLIHRMSCVEFEGNWVCGYDAQVLGTTWRIGIATKSI